MAVTPRIQAMKPAAMPRRRAEVSAETTLLKSKIDESIFYKKQLEKQFIDNKRMLYLLLVVNLAMFAFIIGVLVRYVIV